MSDPRQCWSTPDEFFRLIREEFNPTIDVAASAENTKCGTYVTQEINALAPHVEWLGQPEIEGLPALHTNEVAWCNPPYEDMLPWLKKAREQATKHNGTVLVLGPCDPSVGWWMDGAILADEIRLLNPRIQFDVPPGVKKSSNPKPSALFIFRGDDSRVDISEYVYGPGGGHPLTWTWRWKK